MSDFQEEAVKVKKLIVLFAFCAVALLSVSLAFAEDSPPFILKWGEQGTGPGQFNTARGIAVDQSGNVFVTDGSERVQKFTQPHGSHGC
ncbi:MAG: hypothetical protein HY567_01925 [Candidatus Kerfeldbacteria bacterium]|nr:hypothetical protein [Candidatus Kerfeldbacteria bacterium]